MSPNRVLNCNNAVLLKIIFATLIPHLRNVYDNFITKMTFIIEPAKAASVSTTLFFVPKQRTFFIQMKIFSEEYQD